MDAYQASGNSPTTSNSRTLDAILRRISEEFDRAHELHATRPCTETVKHVKPEPSLADKAEPILRGIATMPSKHLRRDCVSHEIVVPNVHNLHELFAEALASLGFKPEAAQ